MITAEYALSILGFTRSDLESPLMTNLLLFFIFTILWLLFWEIRKIAKTY